MSNTPLWKPVKNVGKLRILWNFDAIHPIPYSLQQLSWLAINSKSPAGQNIDKDLFILQLVSASDFAIRSTKEAAEVKPCPMKGRADRSNAGGSSPTWSPASPIYRAENTGDNSC